MSKTTKQKKSQDTQEQSTPSAETATITEKPSSSSAGESTGARAEDLKCPVCEHGYKSFKLDNASGRVYCGHCGTNATAYQASPKWGPIIEAWKAKYGPDIPNLPEGTPVCESKTFTKDKVENKCGGQVWKHDGKKLLYCGKCGSNYNKPQPENVAEIIKAMGGQLEAPKLIPGPFKDADKQKLSKAARETNEE